MSVASFTIAAADPRTRSDRLGRSIAIALAGYLSLVTWPVWRFARSHGETLPLWVHLATWPALTLILCLALLQPVKGAVVGLQYALGMHGFGAARAKRIADEDNARDGCRNPGEDGSPRFF